MSEENKGGTEQGGEVTVESLQKQIAELNRENAERRTTAKTIAEEKQELQEKLDKINTDREAAEKKAAEEKGEYKSLYEDVQGNVKILTETNENLQKVVKTYLDKEIEKVPEDKRDAIPNLPDAEKLDWLQTHGSTLFGTETASGPGVRPQGKEETETLQDQYNAAKKAGNASLAISLKNKMNQIAAKQKE